MMKKAVVIGGGIAGKLAAKVLSETFQEVIILEADQEYKDKTPRKKVPQSYHPHVLLKSGENSIERLFPGFFRELMENGSIKSNFTRDLKWHHFGNWKQQFSGDLTLVQQSRPLLEFHLQKRIEQVVNITTRYATRVEDLLFDRQYNKITGVKIRSVKTGIEDEIHATLVIDASGNSSQAIKWLKKNNISVVEEKIRIQLFYSTRLFRLKKQNIIPWFNLLISPSFPENPYGAFIQSIEESTFSVTFSGYNNELAPKTNDDFLAYAQKLPVNDVVNFLQHAEPLTEIKIHKIPFQIWRRFDKAKNLPEGLLVVGDSHCRFDPLFGQGISVAAMEAVELQKCLLNKEHHTNGFSQNFHRKISRIIKTPWDMATTEALRHPSIKGKKSLICHLKLWYTKRIYQISAFEPEIYIRLAKVMNLTRAPSHLFHPKIWFTIFTSKKKSKKIN